MRWRIALVAKRYLIMETLIFLFERYLKFAAL